ncbi:MAG: apolipoprotein N-acyltransferase [Henriciella sp.]|uniref:apolipoprotein N-acyltransferase n=1 Tax=Henriciella sp. TaxID=1968823 RepID=UPI000C0DA094|nr:apolipoprotein N-acyltransferase [Henriciella sp.]MBF33957.1 apolipoprotein N-acyltransferase [Hyphomonadaceae bacterium]MBK75819.1 apolipoprotein N-acyltransferase [Henriciella sp.]PHR80161.1 MAG: apolipoprotein N-acyltransferase [Henriciella sp.]
MSTHIQSHGLSALSPPHDWMAKLSGLAATFVAMLLGAIAALGFAPFHFTPALVISLTGIVWMTDGARLKEKWGRSTFLRGWAFGYGFFLISMYWTVSPFLVDPAQHAAYIWMPLVLLPGGMALIWGAGFSLAGAFWSASPSRVFIFAVFMALAELLRGHLFGGFPWNLFGTTWTPGGALSQAASLGGVYWLTLLTLFACAAPAALVDTRDVRGVIGRGFPVTMAVIIAGFGWAWGAQRIASPSQMTGQHVVLMDPGVPQAEKYNGAADQLLRRYLTFLETVDGSDDDIIIWPEGALPFYLLTNTYAIDTISSYLGNRTLIVGATRRGLDEEETLYFNSLAVLDAENGQSELIALYDKHRLVPFGELAAADIIPFGHAMAGLLPDAMQQLASSGLDPGTEPTVLFPRGMPPFVALICYEGLFPEITRNARPQRDQARWIVTISNDAWFGRGLGPAQHYAQNRYRAIESGLPMARVASRGATAMIDGFGRETAHGQRMPGDPQGWVSSVVRAPLPEPAPPTGYQRFGPALFWLTLAGFTVLAFFTWRR